MSTHTSRALIQLVKGKLTVYVGARGPSTHLCHITIDFEIGKSLTIDENWKLIRVTFFFITGQEGMQLFLLITEHRRKYNQFQKDLILLRN